MRKAWTLAFAAIGAIAVGAGYAASAAGLKPAEMLEARVGLMQTVRGQLLPLGAFAHGKPLPADAATRAENIAALASIAPYNWGKGTEHLPHSKTKAAAFGAKAKEFRHGWQVLHDRALVLATAIKAGKMEAARADVGHMAKACKDCHDNFREKD
jgi:cytochrome c556